MNDDDFEKVKKGKITLSYIITGKKICINCNEEKDVNLFYRRGGKENKQHYRSKCKECYHLSKLKNNSEDFVKRREAYRKRKKERAILYRKRAEYNKQDKARDTSMKTKYNISLEDYNKMKNIQDNKCYICKEESKLFIDHCHKSNKVRKLLCNDCNISLGRLRENKSTLENMIKYIEEHS